MLKDGCNISIDAIVLSVEESPTLIRALVNGDRGDIFRKQGRNGTSMDRFYLEDWKAIQGSRRTCPEVYPYSNDRANSRPFVLCRASPELR